MFSDSGIQSLATKRLSCIKLLAFFFFFSFLLFDSRVFGFGDERYILYTHNTDITSKNLVV